MVETGLSSLAKGKAYPQVSVVTVSEPPGVRSVFLILGERRGFELGRPDKAKQVVEEKVREGVLTAQDRDTFVDLLPAALADADRIDAETSARFKALKASEERPALAKKSGPLMSLEEILDKKPANSSGVAPSSA